MDTPAARRRVARRGVLGARRRSLDADADDRDPPRQELRRRQAAPVPACSGPSARRRSPRRCSRDVLAALARVPASTRSRWSPPTASRRGGRRGDACRCSTTPREAGQSPAAQIGIRHALAERLRAGPARAGRHAAARPGRDRRRCSTRRRRAPGVTIVPDRHGTGTNALLLAPPDAIDPSFGPGSFARHRLAAEAAGADVRRRAAAVADARRRHPRGPRPSWLEALRAAAAARAPAHPRARSAHAPGGGLSLSGHPARARCRRCARATTCAGTARPPAAPGRTSADGDVLVVAHKVVSKAEGRMRRLAGRRAGERARRSPREHGKDARVVQVVLDESAEVLRAERGVLVCVTRHGFVCANAGVDQSNCRGERGGPPAGGPGRARRARLRAGIEAARGVRPAVADHGLLRARLAARADRRGDRRRRASCRSTTGAGGPTPTARAARDARSPWPTRSRARQTWRAPRTRASRRCWCAASSAS